MSDKPQHDHSIEIHCIKVGAVEQADELSRRYNLPFLGDCFSDISARLCSTNEASGRRYQQEAIGQGELQVLSPYTGLPAHAAISFVVLNSIFFRFPGQPEFYAASARTRLGHPLIALFFPTEKLLLRWEFHNDKRSIEHEHIAELQSILSRSKVGMTPSGEPAVVLIGHQNFAHHLWNELPALERLITVLGAKSPPELLISREPLGPLPSIFPEISSWSIRKTNGHMPRSINDNGRLFVRLGSYRIPSTLRIRMQRFAEGAASAWAAALISLLRQFSAPTFWVSVRTQKPTIANQVHTLSTLAARLLSRFERCVILFDGFSLPDDWLHCGSRTIEFYRSAGEDSKREIATIIKMIREISAPTCDQLVINAGGCGILDSIALAQLATCYLCHTGTIQHKIGWTTNKPGIVHANRRRIIDKTEQWHHPDRLEDATVPIAVPYTFVDTPPSGENYSVLDPDEFADFVVHNFMSYVRTTTEENCG